MTLRDRLFDFLVGLSLKLDGPLGSDSELFESGMLDSLALFNLAIWVEGELGEELDLTTIDIQKEWRTPGAVLKFIESRNGKELAAPLKRF
jgi:acyl carrier protein